VNVKAIEYISDTSGIVKKKIKPNFRELGKKVGGKMKSLPGCYCRIHPGEPAAT